MFKWLNLFPEIAAYILLWNYTQYIVNLKGIKERWKP